MLLNFFFILLTRNLISIYLFSSMKAKKYSVRIREISVFILAVSLCFAAASFNNAQRGIPVVDLDNPRGSVNLKLSDLLDDITIVPLETRNDLLLSVDRSDFTITENYILVSTRDKLLQFDRQGNYLKTLAISGRGPNEFISNIPLQIVIDYKREIAHYTDYKDRESIFRIDLKTGNFLEPLRPGLSLFSIKSIDSEGNIYGYPSYMDVSDLHLLAYRYDPIDKSLTTYKGYRDFVNLLYGDIMFRQGDEIFFIRSAHSDTLFKISGERMLPHSVIKLKNQRKSNVPSKYATFSFPVYGSWGFVIHKMDNNFSDQGGWFVSITELPTSYLLLNNRGELQSVRSVTIDPFALTIDIDSHIKLRLSERKIEPTPSISGQWAYYAVEAYNMMELIEDALGGNQLTASQRRTLESVAAKIDDDGNPVLIIGKIK